MEPVAVKTRRPKDTPFRQQNKKRPHPLLTPLRTIVLFLLVGVLFVPIGVSIISAADGVVEVESSDYSASCCISNCDAADNWQRVDANPCNVTLTVTQTMKAPVMLYYGLTNFFQNHRDYVKSRSDAQLAALHEYPDAASKIEDECDQVNTTYLNGDDTNVSNLIFPCGLIAWSMFNDSFTMRSPDGGPVALNETDISWKTDRDKKFKNYADGSSGRNFAGFAWERQQMCADLGAPSKVSECNAAQAAGTPESAGWCYPGSGYCFEDEHFIVWMRTSARPTFRKLYARIETDLEPGTYTVAVTNGKLYPAESGYFNPWLSNETNLVPQPFLWPAHTFGTKTLVLSTVSWVGGKNGFLGWAYLVVGVMCIVLAIAFGVKWRIAPRELGSASFVMKDK